MTQYYSGIKVLKITYTFIFSPTRISGSNQIPFLNDIVHMYVHMYLHLGGILKR